MTGSACFRESTITFDSTPRSVISLCRQAVAIYPRRPVPRPVSTRAISSRPAGRNPGPACGQARRGAAASAQSRRLGWSAVPSGIAPVWDHWSAGGTAGKAAPFWLGRGWECGLINLARPAPQCVGVLSGPVVSNRFFDGVALVMGPCDHTALRCELTGGKFMTHDNLCLDAQNGPNTPAVLRGCAAELGSVRDPRRTDQYWSLAPT